MLDCSKIDELMMDWLYQELDESSSASVAEHVHGCARCSAEASALQRTRAAFRDLSPVDPPVAVSAILMHEAARRAPAVAAAPRSADAEGGFWARVQSWFRPIMLHPAAAAVAMLVLIAGVAGTLYVRHGDEMADTQDLKLPATAADSTAARAESGEAQNPASLDLPVAPEPSIAVPAATPAPADEERADRDGYNADLLDNDAQNELSREVAEHQLKAAGRELAKKNFSLEEKKPSPAPPSKGSKKARKPVEDPKGPIANAVSGADPLIEGEMDLRGGSLGNGGSATRGRAADKMEKSAQPPPAPPATSSTATPKQSAPGAIDFADPGAGDTGYRVYKDKPMSQTELRASEGKLGVAVKKKDCLTAARIANDILDRNRDYYYKKVAGQTKPCQMAVNQETKSRARRASKNVGSGKNVGAPQKMKAAPQKDQAAEAAE